MNNEVNLSDKSKRFLDDLRIYLFSSGKKSEEIDEIATELEIHLAEAEKNGKPIEKIIGNSPKEYMQMVSNEMVIDYRAWVKYIFIIIIGSFSFAIYRGLLEGTLSYSILEIIGHSFIVLVSLGILFGAFKYVSGNNFSTVKQILILTIPGGLPIILFLGLIFANQVVETPTIDFGVLGTIIITSLITLFLIGVSIWARTPIIIIMIALVIIPEYLLSFTAFRIDTQAIISSILTFIGIGIFLALSLRKK
ncbi:HAAS domain-containing protein [Ornithinibacillus salinisoli]|uniref:HAAS domain-containing protein n=1 Tax=Ornithinibacillus salinisoli TaxID=1848459 RepID=A0ABW4VWD7_9BACI